MSDRTSICSHLHCAVVCFPLSLPHSLVTLFHHTLWPHSSATLFRHTLRSHSTMLHLCHSFSSQISSLWIFFWRLFVPFSLFCSLCPFCTVSSLFHSFFVPFVLSGPCSPSMLFSLCCLSVPLRSLHDYHAFSVCVWLLRPSSGELADKQVANFQLLPSILAGSGDSL